MTIQIQFIGHDSSEEKARQLISQVFRQQGTNICKDILVILCREDTILIGNLDVQGQFMPRVLRKFNTLFDDEIRRLYYLYEPEYLILIPKHIWTAKPEYFAYVLGHEFGHMAICENERLCTHILSCLVHKHVTEVSDCSLLPEKLPHERYCDQYGKYLATSIFGEDVFNRCLADMIRQSCHQGRRLRRILSMPAQDPDFSVRESLLRQALEPHRKEFVSSWKRARECSRNREDSIANLIDEYHCLMQIGQESVSLPDRQGKFCLECGVSESS